MKIDVGADIEAKCGRCGVTWHIIIAFVDGKIAKVQCKACDAYHRYRSPDGPEKKTRQPKAAASTSPSRSTRSRTQTVEALRVTANEEKEARPYSPRESFEVGDRIIHVKFGDGVVESTPGAGKIEVFFADGRRMLAQARDTQRLEHGRIVN